MVFPSEPIRQLQASTVFGANRYLIFSCNHSQKPSRNTVSKRQVAAANMNWQVGNLALGHAHCTGELGSRFFQNLKLLLELLDFRPGLDGIISLGSWGDAKRPKFFVKHLSKRF